MSDVYDIWLYSLQDWWRTVEEMLDFMYEGQMGNFIFRPVYIILDFHTLVEVFKCNQLNLHLL